MGQKATKARLGVFHHSVRNGNIEKVKELLEEGVMMEDQDDVFGTALHEAVCFDRLEVAELLLQHKADVNAVQKHGHGHGSGSGSQKQGGGGDTPLCVACRKGLLPLVELLVRNGAKINQPGHAHATPLHCALESRHENIAQFLIGASASVNILDSHKMSSLHIACKNLCKQSIELILSSNTSTTSTTTTVAGHTPVATTSSETTLNQHDSFNMTPLMYVCQQGDVALVEFLLKSGAKAKYEAGRSAPLHVTTNTEIATILLDHGADVNARDESFATPLHNACENINGADLVNLFLEHHADLTPHDNTTRSTPLHRACRQGAFRNVQLLLTHGANPNTIDIIKNTPLHVASQLGYSGIVQLLIEHHADQSLLNAEGLTPVQLAQLSPD